MLISSDSIYDYVFWCQYNRRPAGLMIFYKLKYLNDGAQTDRTVQRKGGW